MLDRTSLEKDVREALEGSWRNLTGHSEKCECFGAWPAMWLTGELTRLLSESHCEPMAKFAHVVKEMLLEYRDDGSGCGVESQVPVDAQVDAVIEALESVRKSQLTVGAWSDAPVTELMCG